MSRVCWLVTTLVIADKLVFAGLFVIMSTYNVKHTADLIQASTIVSHYKQWQGLLCTDTSDKSSNEAVFFLKQNRIHSAGIDNNTRLYD